MKITILGGGSMGLAFAKGLLSTKIVSSASLSIIERDSERIEALKAELGCLVSDNWKQGCLNADVLLIAVKPQESNNLLKALKGNLDSVGLVISIMAGVSLENIRKMLGNGPKIVRAMPNLPAAVGQGITGFFTVLDLNQEEQLILNQVLSSVGRVYRIDSETLIDSLTALTGTGPAYFYFLVEALTFAAVNLGFKEDLAEELVNNLFIGSSALLEHAEASVAKSLRAQVTSKGGTTEAAIFSLQQQEFFKIVYQAVQAGLDRAKELNAGLLKD